MTWLSLSWKGPFPPCPQVRRYLSRVRREGTARVKMFFIVTVAYLLFWGPLFVVTLVNWHWHFEEAKQSMAHEVGPNPSSFFWVQQSITSI